MKFSTALVALFSVASVFASADFEKCKGQVLNINSACTAEVGEDREQACRDSLSEKCQNFFVNPLTVEAECENLTDDEKKSLVDFVNEKHADNNLYCKKSTNGQYCPFGDILISAEGLTEESFKEAINNTCKYKDCIYLTIESIRATLINDQNQNIAADTYMEWYENALSFLESNACTELSQ